MYPINHPTPRSTGHWEGDNNSQVWGVGPLYSLRMHASPSPDTLSHVCLRTPALNLCSARGQKQSDVGHEPTAVRFTGWQEPSLPCPGTTVELCTPENGQGVFLPGSKAPPGKLRSLLHTPAFGQTD